jgi:hypothetical protein
LANRGRRRIPFSGAPCANDGPRGRAADTDKPGCLFFIVLSAPSVELSPTPAS